MVPNYIERELEAMLMGEILETPPGRWVQVRGRRLQMWGGEVTSEGLINPENLPVWVEILAARLYSEGLFPWKPNHALINDYQPGEGIMPHTDGPAYYPQVAIVSLNSPAVFQYWTQSRKPCLSVYVEPRSLLVFSGRFYTDLLHSVEAKRSDVWVSDGCGKTYTEVGDSISELGNPVESRASETASQYICPYCAQNLLEGGGSIRTEEYRSLSDASQSGFSYNIRVVFGSKET